MRDTEKWLSDALTRGAALLRAELRTMLDNADKEEMIARRSAENRPATGPEHQCAACPVEVRDLMASAHNAVVQFDSWARTGGDFARTARKMRELAEAVERVQSIVDQHFKETKR